ncbi:MAG: beta-hexosaminidase [Clostridia bacterium]|nr:beta-hexosaminidase [Clostridia bacterium]
MKLKPIVFAIIIVIATLGLISMITRKKSNQTNISETPKVEEEDTINLLEPYYEKAKQKLQTLTQEEKIGQIFLCRYPEKNAIEDMQTYKLGGYLWFEKDFKNKTEDQIKEEISNLQKASNIPLLIAIDEEGGKVVRASSNTNLRTEKFKSPSDLYKEGGYERIKQDTIEKSKFLSNLGINLNLAPVVDVTTNPLDYMYQRSLGEDTEKTSDYAKTVIEASREGTVSYTLKHFPGYGNNSDTHKGSSKDTKSYEEIEKIDLPPFKAGIKAGAEAVLVSHNIVESIDAENPASLSPKINKILRENLNFKGIIITDDLYMGAVSEDSEAVIKSVQAGNDIIIVTDYKKSIEDIQKAIENGTISLEKIDKMVTQILAWKYYKGLMQ